MSVNQQFLQQRNTKIFFGMQLKINESFFNATACNCFRIHFLFILSKMFDSSTLNLILWGVYEVGVKPLSFKGRLNEKFQRWSVDGASIEELIRYDDVGVNIGVEVEKKAGSCSDVKWGSWNCSGEFTEGDFMFLPSSLVELRITSSSSLSRSDLVWCYSAIDSDITWKVALHINRYWPPQRRLFSLPPWICSDGRKMTLKAPSIYATENLSR